MEHKKSISLIYDNRQLLRGLVPQEVVDGRHLCCAGHIKSSWEPGHVQGYPAPALLCGPPEQGMLMATVSGGFCMISTPALSSSASICHIAKGLSCDEMEETDTGMMGERWLNNRRRDGHFDLEVAFFLCVLVY